MRARKKLNSGQQGTKQPLGEYSSCLSCVLSLWLSVDDATIRSWQLARAERIGETGVSDIRHQENV